MIGSLFFSLRRTLAFFLDLLIILFLIFIIQHFAASALLIYGCSAVFPLQNFGIVIVCMYFIIGNSRVLSYSTPGQKIFRLKLSPLNEERIGLFRIITRTLLFFGIPWLVPNMMIRLTDTGYTDIKGIIHGAPVFVFILVFSTTLLPISTLIGGGRQGIQDIFFKIACGSINAKPDIHVAINKKRLIAHTLFGAVVLSLSIATLSSIVTSLYFPKDKTTLLSQKISRAGLHLENSPFTHIFEEVPSYHSFCFENNGHFLISEFHDSPKARAAIGEALELPEYVHESIMGYGFLVTQTKSDLSLIDNKSIITIPAATPIVHAIIYLDALGYQDRYAKGLILSRSAERIFKNAPIIQDVNCLCLQLVHKVRFGYISMGFFERYYLLRSDHPPRHFRQNKDDLDSNNVISFFNTDNLNVMKFASKKDFEP